MQYSQEVENMCPVAKGAYHGPAPIPEEGQWVQALSLIHICTCQVEIEAGDTLDNTTSFESAIARLQERLDAERSDARADSRAICVAATRKDKGACLLYTSRCV